MSDLNSDLSWMNPCRATFCGSDGRVYTASLNSLAIEFPDYFVKLQVAETFTMVRWIFPVITYICLYLY